MSIGLLEHGILLMWTNLYYLNTTRSLTIHSLSPLLHQQPCHSGSPDDSCWAAWWVGLGVESGDVSSLVQGSQMSSHSRLLIPIYRKKHRNTLREVPALITFDLDWMVEWLACPRLGICIGLDELVATPSTSDALRSSFTPASCVPSPSATACLWCC